MDSIYINGIGVISSCGQSMEDILLAASGKKSDIILNEKIEFHSPLPASKVRRCPRYIKMAAACAALAVGDGKIADPEKTGTIISTGYGAVESSIAFSDSVVRGNPALCSPSVFSATVPNSCVGQICIIFGYKGFSTLLTAGDPVEYSALLLHSKRAETVICGAVEEYNEELEYAVRASGILKDIPVSEGAAMLVLSGEKTEDTCCRVCGFSSVSLPEYPYLHRIEEAEAETALTEMFREIADIKMPDIVLTQKNGTYFDAVEKKALEKGLGNHVLFAEPKKIFGETFGCGYLLNIALGAAMIKEQVYPSALLDDSWDGREIRTVMAAGIDVHGNYLAVLLEK